MSEEIEVSVQETVVPKKKTREVKSEQSEDSVSEGMALGIFALNEKAVIPSFATDGSACFDLSACFEIGDKIDCIIQEQKSFRRASDNGIAIHAGERFLIPTGLIFDIPEGYCLEIYPRSGISFKQGLTLSNCTAIIDSDYVEQTFISIHNMSGSSRYIQAGDRIGQAKLVKLVTTKINVLSSKPGQKTSRSGGFGSTGK